MVATNDTQIVATKLFITVENFQFGAKIKGMLVDNLSKVFVVDF